MRINCLIGSLCLSALLVACGGGGGDSAPPKEPRLPTGEALRAEVERVRASKDMPGLSVVVLDKDRMETVITGRRIVAGPDLITNADAFQTGSLTKAASALLIARLVEQRKLRWDSTMAEIFPAWSAQMHASLRPVTVQQLLRHRSGIKRDIDEADAVQLRPRATGNVGVDRALVGQYYLQQAPQLPPGGQNVYSNVGYLIVGLIAEAVGGDTYEHLMKKEVFGPLQMTASFGLPEDGGPGALSGHVMAGNAWQVARYSDETRLWLSLMHPAGGMKLSMADYGKYLHEHLLGLQGKSTYLSAETFKLIHTPVEGYGFGWHVADDPEVGGRFSVHNGTILTYYSITILVPGTQRAIAVSCNCYAESANAQIDELLMRLAVAKS